TVSAGRGPVRLLDPVHVRRARPHELVDLRVGGGEQRLIDHAGDEKQSVATKRSKVVAAQHRHRRDADAFTADGARQFSWTTSAVLLWRAPPSATRSQHPQHVARLEMDRALRRKLLRT